MTLSWSPSALLAGLCTAAAVGLLLWQVDPPPRRLRTRLQSYTTPSLAELRGREPGGAFALVFGPMLRDLADWVGQFLDRAGSEVTVNRLRQAGWHHAQGEQAMVSAYRLAQLRTLALSVAASIGLGQLLGSSGVLRLVLGGMGVMVGATRTNARLTRAIESRRDLMKIEIYTINQLLAMRVRAGGGVIQAVTATTRRGRGEVIDELKAALRLHRAGWSGPDSFRRIAELTPEPYCSRTYRLLASAEERGADLAGALLSLSEDVRETRRESIKRTATKRRAAMLIPTIAILAPVLILFVAAPLPYLITSWR